MDGALIAIALIALVFAAVMTRQFHVMRDIAERSQLLAEGAQADNRKLCAEIYRLVAENKRLSERKP